MICSALWKSCARRTAACGIVSRIIILFAATSSRRPTRSAKPSMTRTPEHMKEELGDVLLQVVFHAQMEKERGTFDIDDVADGICKKLIFRHPHIFGNVEVASSEEVLRNWDDLKRKEKHQETDTQALESVAKSLPSLIRAEKLQKKAAKVGFDWDNVKDALDKVQEELDEVRRAIDGDGDPEEEIGDLLFASVNVARHLKIDPEAAAEKTCKQVCQPLRGDGAIRRLPQAKSWLTCPFPSWTHCGTAQSTRNTHKEQNHEEKRTGDAGRRKDRLFQEGHRKRRSITVFTAIADIMAAGDRLQISGFGTFETKGARSTHGTQSAYRRGDQYCSGHYAGVLPAKLLKDKVDGNK